ncbi:hypothetical protein [Reyranella sp.]|uniref:hypothetical protein n=1 Tax=Reyranella sp. TaxID=1929291 RepID=UPI003C79AE1D
MPLRWEILDPQKLIHVVAEGEVTLKEMEAHFDALVVANALGYSKLFDATRLKPVYDAADVMAMGARLSAYTEHFPSGPLAVIGRDESVVLAFKRFVNISPSKRPAALFSTEKKARAWLAKQAAPEVEGPKPDRGSA